VETGVIYLVAGQVDPAQADEEEPTGGFADGPTTTSRFNLPQGIVYAGGGIIYVADCDNHRIRQVDLNSNTVSTLVGGGIFGSRDGVGIEGRLRHPTEVAFDHTRKILYVSDHYNHRLRYVSWDNPAGEPTLYTLAGAGGRSGYCDGLGAQARFNYPEGIWVNESSAQLLVADFSNNLIRVVGGVGHSEQGLVATLAGTLNHGASDGTAAAYFSPPTFSGPSRICGGSTGTGITPDGVVYVVDQMNHRVRAIHFPSANASRASLSRKGQLALLFVVLLMGCVLHCARTRAWR
jgi:DNA-binding beta-propeller fold protein YncE